MVMLLLLGQLELFYPINQDSLYLKGYYKGYREGSCILPFNSFKDGFMGGLFFGCMGGGCATGMQTISFQIPEREIKSRFDLGYQHGYKKASLLKRIHWTFMGGLIGTGCNIACVVFTALYFKEKFNL